MVSQQKSLGVASVRVVRLPVHTRYDTVEFSEGAVYIDDIDSMPDVCVKLFCFCFFSRLYYRSRVKKQQRESVPHYNHGARPERGLQRQE